MPNHHAESRTQSTEEDELVEGLPMKSMGDAARLVSERLRAPKSEAEKFRSMAACQALMDYHDTLRVSRMADRETLRLWVGRIQRWYR